MKLSNGIMICRPSDDNDGDDDDDDGEDDDGDGGDDEFMVC